MRDNSLYSLGGAGAILMGVLGLAVGITSLLIPANLLGGVPDVQSPFMYWEANKTMVLINWWALGLQGALGLAVIPAVSRTVEALNEGWVRWMTSLAMLAFAVMILDNYWSIVYTSARASAYLTGTPAMRAALTVPGAPQAIDVQGWLINGAGGLYWLVAGGLALRGRVWPRGLAYLAILAGGFFNFLLLASQVLPEIVVSGWQPILGGVGGALSVAGYIWMGLFLRRLAHTEGA